MMPAIKKIFSRPFIMLSVLLVGLAGCKPHTETEAPAETPAKEMAMAPDTAQKAKSSLPIIDVAPTWSLTDIEGKSVGSEALKGKVVVVDFWATWCAPCREEIPGYIEMQKKYGKDGLVIVGVSVDTGGPAKVVDFAKKFGVNYTLVMADNDMVQAFGGLNAIPTTFLIDREGNIRDVKIGSMPTAVYEKTVLKLLN